VAADSQAIRVPVSERVEPRSTLSHCPVVPLFAHQRVAVEPSTALAAVLPLEVSSLLAVAA
jgi:hypothetical protein